MFTTRHRIPIVAAALAVAGPFAAAGPVGATTEPPPATFEIPAERWDALEAAGLGWIFATEGYPSQPDGVPWPTEEWPVGELPEGFDAAAIDEFITWALAPPEGESCCIDAIVAVQGGELMIERYRDGWDPAEAHVSWSTAKSITMTMIGILVAEGRLDVFAPADVPEWADASDPRHPISIDEMLHMRSGLEWVEEYEGTSDVTEMLFGAGAADRAHFAADRPLAAAPGELFNYSTGISMILSRIIADEVGYFDEGTQWAQDELFGPLGITSVVHDLDDTGVMSGGSAINMTALDFARFGQLYLRGGQWDGDQIVPEEWVDYARMPVANTPEYGAHWWVVGAEDKFPDAFQAIGFNGQLITVVPSLDLVIVVLSNEPGLRPDLVAARILQAFDEA
ncbi:MAG TPA: serine hydrolase, partial [Desertimonas sp.]|nr:serine hydrolase [Desertimonas sp.]